MPPDAFLRGLNSILPDDIGVTKAVEVPSDFHARYSATGKTYCYTLWNAKEKDPFMGRYSWQVPMPFSLERMNRFCKCLVGTHDFVAFSSAGRSVEDTVRTLSVCQAERKGETVVLTVTGNGFLYNMVRIIVGSAVEAAKGREFPLDEIFRTGQRDLLGLTAPAKGLCLQQVHYPDDPFGETDIKRSNHAEI